MDARAKKILVTYKCYKINNGTQSQTMEYKIGSNSLPKNHHFNHENSENITYKYEKKKKLGK